MKFIAPMLLTVSACFASLTAAEPIPVVTGNTIVHDLAKQIGGERFAVTCLLEPGVDPHAYQPVPEDLRRLAAAELVIINGLGFEGWFERLAEEAAFDGTLVVATRGIEPIPTGDHGDHDDDHDDDHHAEHGHHDEHDGHAEHDDHGHDDHDDHDGHDHDDHDHHGPRP